MSQPCYHVPLNYNYVCKKIKLQKLIVAKPYQLPGAWAYLHFHSWDLSNSLLRLGYDPQFEKPWPKAKLFSKPVLQCNQSIVKLNVQSQYVYQLFSIRSMSKISNSVMSFTNILIFLASAEIVSKTLIVSIVVLHIDSNAWVWNFRRIIRWANLTRGSAFSEIKEYKVSITEYLLFTKKKALI